MSDPDRFACAIQAIDGANRQDPTSVDVDGERRPKELVHAERMSEWVERLSGDPKMSSRGVAAATSLELPERERRLLEAARSRS